nr:hypothetical protein [uncultured archaeon]
MWLRGGSTKPEASQPHMFVAFGDATKVRRRNRPEEVTVRRVSDESQKCANTC